MIRLLLFPLLWLMDRRETLAWMAECAEFDQLRGFPITEPDGEMVMDAINSDPERVMWQPLPHPENLPVERRTLSVDATQTSHV